jgi:class 3 adenylate cyclase
MAMLPESIPHYSVGPFFGLAANSAMAILCLVILALYRHYHPLRSLFLFYLFIALTFLGWVVYGLQKSPESILLGNRILYAALAFLPAIWFRFYLSLFNERSDRLTWIVTGISFTLAALALLGRGPLLFGFPMEPDPIAMSILRPQSKLLRPLIQSFCLAVCLFYLTIIVARLWRFKDQRRVYLISVAIGLLFWFLGGLHDALRANGVTILIKGQVLWFASFWLSIFLTIAVTLHFRSIEQAVQEARDVFERFVPPAYLRRIAAQGLRSIRLGEADQQWVTILCCDLRGFTPLSERLNPSELISFINRVLERMTRVVDGWRGVIDKFLGDAVLCIFEGADSAERAVSCGVDMLSAVKSFNAEEERPSSQAVQIGIGLHTGPVILGTIGSSERMDSTVLGLTVNLAKRLEEITRPLGVDMLISDQVAQRLPELHGHRFRKLGEVSVKGCSAPLTVFEVYDQDPPGIRNLKDRIRPIMVEGIELFEADHLDAALSKLQEAQSIFPQDPPLRLLVTSLGQALEQEHRDKRTALLNFR